MSKQHQDSTRKQNRIIKAGDPIPVGGLSPKDVFDSKVSGINNNHTTIETGKEPPFPWKTVTEDHGYTEADLKALAIVGDYRFGSIMIQLNNDNIEIPSHPDTDFDEQWFLTLLRGSISLSADEKWRIIQVLPNLSQYQVDELMGILCSEFSKFSRLSPAHLPMLQVIERKYANAWTSLQKKISKT